jgi:hypothetical protein
MRRNALRSLLGDRVVVTITRPQRISPIAPPGTLQKRLIGLNVRARLKEIADSDPVYLSQIRQLPCLYCSLEPCGQAAHVRRQSGVHNKRGGMGKKPADRWALSLCFEHHMLQHRLGELQFWYALGIDPLLLCERLHAKRGDLSAMRAIVLLAIAERG